MDEVVRLRDPAQATYAPLKEVGKGTERQQPAAKEILPARQRLDCRNRIMNARHIGIYHTHNEEVVTMKYAVSCILLASLTLIMSCGTSQEVTSFWKNPEGAKGKTYSSVMIVATTADKAARNTVEGDLAAAAAGRGLKATRSIDAFPSSFTKDNVPSKEEMMAKIAELKCDAVFTVALLDEKSEQRYVPGTTTYATVGYGAGAYAPYPQYGYYGNYSSYTAYSYPMTTTPGYYTTDKTYFIEGNLYDGETGTILWSMQSSAYNPSSLSSFSKGYAKTLIDELEKQNIGTPKKP